MRHAIVPIVPKEECSKEWNHYVKINDRTMCAGGVDKRTGKVTGPCQGDSGGALMCSVRSGEPWKVFGVVSWGSFICMAKPAVFTDVTKYDTWIRQSMQQLGAPIPTPVPKAIEQKPKRECKADNFEIKRNYGPINDASLLRRKSNIGYLHAVQECCNDAECTGVLVDVPRQIAHFLKMSPCSTQYRSSRDFALTYIGFKCSA